MILYSYWASSSAYRVRIALELKGVEYRLRTVDLKAPPEDMLELQTVNPLGQVPVLDLETEGGGLVISQSLAILEYLEERYPEPPLLPKTAAERARVRQCAELVNAGIQPLQNLSVQNKLRELGSDPAPFVQHFVRRGLLALEQIAAASNGPFTVGERVTLADVCVIPQLFASRRFGVALDDLTALSRVERECSAFPAFQRAHPAAQPDAPVPPT